MDVTEEQIRRTAAELAEQQKRETEEAADAVAQLDLEDLGAVAGGADSPQCKDTYLHREDCFGNDGCDRTIHWHDDYLCLHNDLGHHCDFSDEFDCVKVIF